MLNYNKTNLLIILNLLGKGMAMHSMVLGYQSAGSSKIYQSLVSSQLVRLRYILKLQLLKNHSNIFLNYSANVNLLPKQPFLNTYSVFQ